MWIVVRDGKVLHTDNKFRKEPLEGRIRKFRSRLDAKKRADAVGGQVDVEAWVVFGDKL